MPPRGYCQTLLRTRSLRRKTSWFMRPYFTSLCIREYFRPLRADQKERQREWKRTRGKKAMEEGGRGHKIGKGEGISRRTSARNFVLRVYWSAYGEEDVRGLRSKPRPSLPLLSPFSFSFFFFFFFSVLVRDAGVVAKSVSISVNAIAHCDSFQWFQIGKSVLEETLLRSRGDLHRVSWWILNISFEGKYFKKFLRDKDKEEEVRSFPLFLSPKFHNNCDRISPPFFSFREKCWLTTKSGMKGGVEHGFEDA